MKLSIYENSYKDVMEHDVYLDGKHLQGVVFASEEESRVLLVDPDNNHAVPVEFPANISFFHVGQLLKYELTGKVEIRKKATLGGRL